MTDTPFNQRPGTLDDLRTLRIQRRLPGSVDRVWACLTESDLRRQWLAAGDMILEPGASFELVWRNDELSDSAAERPEGFGAEHRATCRFEDVRPPHHLRYVWPGVGEVSFDLEPAGDDVLLTVTHRGLDGDALTLNVSAGWHAHLAILVAQLEGQPAPSLWRTWSLLRSQYEELLCAH